MVRQHLVYTKRMQMGHKNKYAINAGLNLVSLMDIFTIILLFLLFNVSGEEEAITVPDIVRLPVSIASVKPAPVTTVYITGDSILVGDKKVADTQDVMKSDEPGIVSLENELIMQMSQDEQA